MALAMSLILTGSYELVFLFTRNHPSHAAFRIWDIAIIPRNNMHVAMKDRLTSGFADVNTDIISIGMETLVNFLLHILQHHVHCLALVVGQVEVGSDVPLGDDECMTGRDRISIVECNTSCRLADDFHSTRKSTERTLLAFHTGQLVEMVVLVEFVAFVGDEALVRQFYITLVRVLLVDGMKSEALFRQVATYRKVGCPLGGKQVGDIHQHLGLGVGFQDVQHIVAEDGVEFTLRKIRAVVVIVADDVKALLPEFVRIETKSTSEIENLAPEQIVLHEVSRGHGEIRALDGCEVRVIYLLWFHRLQYFHISKPILRAI